MVEHRSYKTTFEQLLSYGGIGIVLNAFLYLLYLLATHYRFSPKTSMTVLYVLGVVLSVLANRKWTFRSQVNYLVMGYRAVFTYVGGYIINYLLLYVLVDRYAFPHQLVQFFAIGIVAVYLFIVSKLFIFRTLGTRILQS